MKVVPALFVGCFAFLLASFPARNPDLFRHLAMGRQLATNFHLPLDDVQEGESSLGYQGWLYDLFCYGVYSAGGGESLVLIKALLVAGIAVLLFQLSRSGAGWLVPALCTILALLAMSSQLGLQPAIISCFFFALALWIYRKEMQTQVSAGPSAPPSLFLPWPLLCLFVIWVNTDSGFLLGLGTIALCGLGTFLDGCFLADAAASKENHNTSTFPKLLRWIVSLGILAAACLLNPYFLGAFSLPPNLLDFSSPFQSANFFSSWQAGLAYVLLLGLGVLSFFLNVPRRNLRRLLPWLGLALISGLQVKAVPFFAVLSAPVLSWNFLEWYTRRWAPSAVAGVSPSPNRIGTVCAVVLGLVLLVCAWAGRLQTQPFEPRRWGIEVNPSLAQGAATSRNWQQQGKFGQDTRGLHFSSETADAFAWFCPEEKGVLDRALAAAVLDAPNVPAFRADRLRQARISHVIVYDPDARRLFSMIGKLLAYPGHWPLLYLEGTVAVFGWRDWDPPKRWFQNLELDLNQLAYHPCNEKIVPSSGPQAEPRVRSWWDDFSLAAPGANLDQDEAVFHWLQAGTYLPIAAQRNLLAWEFSRSAGLVASAGNWPVPVCLLECHRRLVFFRPQLPAAGSSRALLPPLDQLALTCQQMFARQRDDTPPALLYLAIRAARRALAANPADHRAYLVLGESYRRLLHHTRERIWASHFKPLVHLRQVQASVALNHVVRLRPRLPVPHLDLFQLYEEMGYLDLARKHLQTYRTLTPSRDPGLDRLDMDLTRLTKQVRENENEFAKKAKGRVLDRALLAIRLGLGGKALELLLESDIAAFGKQGMILELELLLKTGRAKEVREWLAGDQARKAKATLGEISYYWFRAQALAAWGDYALAEEEFTHLSLAWRKADLLEPRLKIALAVSKQVLDEQPFGKFAPQFLSHIPFRVEFRTGILAFARNLRQEANALVLRALLALEMGKIENTRTSLQTALDLWQSEAAAASGAGLDFNARTIAQHCLQWLK
jgi:hypothetical protein